MSEDWYKYSLGDSAKNSFWDSLPTALQGLAIGLIAMFSLIVLALIILQIVGMAKAFKKANQHGWAAIVPFYNTFTIIKISGLELWWFAILVLSGAGAGYFAAGCAVVLSGFVNYKVAKSFGKDLLYAVGLTLLGPIFWMILGYSPDIKYVGPAGPYKINYPSAPKK